MRVLSCFAIAVSLDYCSHNDTRNLTVGNMDFEDILRRSLNNPIAAEIENIRRTQNILAPIAPFNYATVASQIFVDVNEHIRRSTEQWLALHQDAATQIVKQAIASFAHLEEITAAAVASFDLYCEEEAPEACRLLSEAGWIGMDRHFSIAQMRESVLIHKTQGESAMNDAIRDYFNEDDSALLVNISEGCLRSEEHT